MKRLSRTTGWVVAGGVAMTGVFSVAAAHSFSGKVSSDSSTGVVGATDLQPTADSTGSSAATGTLTPPTTAAGSVAPAQAPGATDPPTTAAPPSSEVTAPPATAAPDTTVAPPVQTVRPSRRRAAVSSGGS